MITYDKYAEIRDIKGMTDGKVAEKAGIGRSTFSDWKSGRSVPKLEKMQKIAEALEMEYSQFIGPLGKFSAYIQESPDIKVLQNNARKLQQTVGQIKPLPMLDGLKPQLQTLQQQLDNIDRELLDLFHNVSEETQSNVMLILKNSQKDPDSKSSKEA